MAEVPHFLFTTHSHLPVYFPIHCLILTLVPRAAEQQQLTSTLGKCKVTPEHFYLQHLIAFTIFIRYLEIFPLMLPHKILSSVPPTSAVRKFIVLEVRQGTGRGDRAAGKIKISLLLLGDSKVAHLYNSFL